MMNKEFQYYNGSIKKDLPPRQVNTKINDPSLYIPSNDLINAVNVALHLGQPLLLTGEPGTGKTRLADHISYIFGLSKPLVFNAKTTSSVKDLFYFYDALGHFQYSQTRNNPILIPDQIESRFIRYEALGKAIKEEGTFVVLIDEIDKAPRDFPNDILGELENLHFSIPEIGKSYQCSAEAQPIILMTSNSEKNLPDAFLRRVAYYHIPFPNAKELLNILKAKVLNFESLDLDAIIEHFQWIRSGRKVKMQKNPATAELIYWTQLLVKMGINTSSLRNPEELTKEDQEKLKVSYSVLAKTKEDLFLLKGLV